MLSILNPFGVYSIIRVKPALRIAVSVNVKAQGSRLPGLLLFPRAYTKDTRSFAAFKISPPHNTVVQRDACLIHVILLFRF